jgi:hypothetical protein
MTDASKSKDTCYEWKACQEFVFWIGEGDIEERKIEKEGIFGLNNK